MEPPLHLPFVKLNDLNFRLAGRQLAKPRVRPCSSRLNPLRCTSIPPESCCLNEASCCMGGRVAAGRLRSAGTCPALAQHEALLYLEYVILTTGERCCVLTPPAPPSSTTHPLCSPNPGSSGRRGRAAKGKRALESAPVPRACLRAEAAPVSATSLGSTGTSGASEPRAYRELGSMAHQHRCWRNLSCGSGAASLANSPWNSHRGGGNGGNLLGKHKSTSVEAAKPTASAPV